MSEPGRTCKQEEQRGRRDISHVWDCGKYGVRHGRLHGMKCEVFYYAICFTVFHLSIVPSPATPAMDQLSLTEPEDHPNDSGVENESDDDDYFEELPYRAEFRTIMEDDPEAYNFGTAPYSAHKLPKEVVEADCEGDDAWKLVMEQWESSVANSHLSSA